MMVTRYEFRSWITDVFRQVVYRLINRLVFLLSVICRF